MEAKTAGGYPGQKLRPGIGHDILDFCVRELGTLGGGGAIIDECSCQIPFVANRT